MFKQISTLFQVKLFFICLCIVPFLFFCPEVFAAIFDVVPTDKSQQYLGTIFGGNIGVIHLGGPNNPLLSRMFEKFNIIIVTVGSVVVSWIGIISVINTAREGEALGKKISAWVIMRAIIGMGLMAPTPASGYSIVQVTVMWVVLNGIGAANMVWNVVLNQLAYGVQAIGTSTDLLGADDPRLQDSALLSLVGQVFNSSVCMQAINTQAGGTPATRLYGPVRIFRPNTTGIVKTQTLYVGIDQPNLQDLCGKYTISTNKEDNIQERLDIKYSALYAMFDALNTPAALLVANATLPSTIASSPPIATGYVQSATEGYRAQLMQLSAGLTKTTEAPAVDVTGLKQIGWIHAGNYYFALSKSSRNTIDDDAYTPAPTSSFTGRFPIVGVVWDPTATSTPSGTVWSAANANFVNQFKGSNATQTTNNMIRINSALIATANYLNQTNNVVTSIPNLISNNSGSGNEIIDKLISALTDPMTKALVSFMQSVMNSTSDPLIGLPRFGFNLMASAEFAGITMIGIAFFFALVASPAMCISPTAPPTVLVLIELGLVLMGALIMLWTAGATLNIYLPMVPYLIFTSTAFGWMMAVTELIVGAPIVALGLVHPSDGELGKVTAGLAIIGNVFLRPTLMIFGFILGGTLMRAGINLVNFGFLSAVTGRPPTSTIFSFIAVLMMYMMFMVAIINKAFSLIYELPNQILRYMGGPSERHGAESIVQDAKGGFDKGAEAGAKGLGKGLEKATKEVDKAGEKWLKERGESRDQKAEQAAADKAFFDQPTRGRSGGEGGGIEDAGGEGGGRGRSGGMDAGQDNPPDAAGGRGRSDAKGGKDDAR